jgi:hypothetical protein
MWWCCVLCALLSLPSYVQFLEGCIGYDFEIEYDFVTVIGGKINGLNEFEFIW